MIRHHESYSGTQLTYVRALDGVHDLTEIASNRAASGRDDMGNASISGDYHFTGTRSLEEAVELAQWGWPEGVEKIKAIAEAIEIDPALLKSAIKIESYFDVAGDEPDIDRYLQGVPENMVTYPSVQQSHGKVLDLVVNAGQHAHVDKQLIENRGAAVLAAVEALRTHGYSIGVFVVEQCRASYGYESAAIRYEIPVLEPGQSVNVDTLAFSIMHPSFLRRLLFAANEIESREIRRKFGFHSGGGYGIPLPMNTYDPGRPAYIIDKDDGLYPDQRSTAKFAQKLVEECLRTLSAEA